MIGRRWFVVGGLFAACCIVVAAPADGQLEVAKPAPVTPDSPEVLKEVAAWPVGRVIEGEAEQRIRAALDSDTTLEFLDTQLSDVASILSGKHSIPVLLDLAPLAADGKSAETLVTLKLAGVKLRSALRSLLDPIGATFVVQNEALIITTKTYADNITPTRVYQVHDLVVVPNRSTVAVPDFESLLELISLSVQPETWRENGGTYGEYRSFQGPGILVLVITQREEAHEQIEKLLADLRAAREPKVLEAQQHQGPSSAAPAPSAASQP